MDRFSIEPSAQKVLDICIIITAIITIISVVFSTFPPTFWVSILSNASYMLKKTIYLPMAMYLVRDCDSSTGCINQLCQMLQE